MAGQLAIPPVASLYMLENRGMPWLAVLHDHARAPPRGPQQPAYCRQAAPGNHRHRDLGSSGISPLIANLTCSLKDLRHDSRAAIQACGDRNSGPIHARHGRTSEAPSSALPTWETGRFLPKSSFQQPLTTPSSAPSTARSITRWPTSMWLENVKSTAAPCSPKALR